MVHYVSYGTPGGEYPSTCRAAVVTAGEHGSLDDPAISLAVLNPEGMFFNRDVPYRDPVVGNLVGGSWHWPERVEE